MVQLMVLYGQPADPQAFYDYYFSTHVPLAKSIPGLRSFTASDGAVTHADGTGSPYALVAVLTFDDSAALKKGFSSPEGRATAADLKNFASGGVTMLTYDARAV